MTTVVVDEVVVVDFVDEEEAFEEEGVVDSEEEGMVVSVVAVGVAGEAFAVAEEVVEVEDIQEEEGADTIHIIKVTTGKKMAFCTAEQVSVSVSGNVIQVQEYRRIAIVIFYLELNTIALICYAVVAVHSQQK